jgi:hypothetical protein
MKKTLLSVVLVSSLTLPAHAQLLDVQVSENELTARVALGGQSLLDLAVRFEDARGLSADSLGLSVGVVQPWDLSLLLRLPSTLTTVVGVLPVLLTIEPPGNGGLEFRGLTSFELYTRLLPYLPNLLPLRLFAASDGGPFRDVTELTAGGSYRIRGCKGSFSEFLILLDLRAVDQVLRQKFNHLEQLLTVHDEVIADPLEAELLTLLSQAWTAYQARNLNQAMDRIATLETRVREASGTGIPDLWRASRDVTNVAGELRGAAATLLFSLRVKANRLW